MKLKNRTRLMVGNITKLESSRMLSELFSEITYSLQDPCLLLNQDGMIVSYNHAAKIKFQIIEIEPLQMNDLVVDDPTRVTQLLQMWLKSKSPLPSSLTFKNNLTSEVRYLCKGNVLRPAQKGESVSIMIQCIKKKESIATFITLNEKVDQLKREIVERRNIERKIRNLNVELEQRVRERTEELEKLNIELSRSLENLKNTQKHLLRTERITSLGRLVAGVAHEINNPVDLSIKTLLQLGTQINHYNKMYKEDRLTRSDQTSFFNVASESSNIVLANLRNTADLIRSFKQLTEDQLSDESRLINLKNYINDLLLNLQHYFFQKSHNIEIICPEDIDIKIYPGAIAQIITNLISNSIQHAFEGVAEGLIRIKIMRENDRILIHYNDNGIGVPAENLPYIFDPFYTTKKNKGHIGLGLSIIYVLVTSKLNGEIRTTSKEKQGLSFDISFPV